MSGELVSLKEPRSVMAVVAKSFTVAGRVEVHS
jgi:hypothetical protein